LQSLDQLFLVLIKVLYQGFHAVDLLLEVLIPLRAVDVQLVLLSKVGALLFALISQILYLLLEIEDFQLVLIFGMLLLYGMTLSRVDLLIECSNLIPELSNLLFKRHVIRRHSLNLAIGSIDL
jgi:hypothetical protein